MSENTPYSSPKEATVILVAAGSGSRFGATTPKQYVPLSGKPVLRHTLEALIKHPHIRQIVVVINNDFRDLYDQAVAGLPKLLPPVQGGETRQQSVLNALRSLDLYDNEIVLIHDAARPCFSQRSIDDILSALETVSAASLGVPVSDTLRKTSNGTYQDIVDRSGLYAMQTPQGFHYGLIKSAHEKFSSQNFTDDTALATSMGIDVKIISGDQTNLKITTQDDMKMAEKFLGSNSLIPRTGIGFDVHAFGDASTSIRIGGVDIPHSHKLKGHSDADVLLHAITDALYGVIADGDIGSHFPPNNPDYKGKDSAFFLEEALQAVRQQGGKIIHVDSVIMCEAPKIGPHRGQIQNRIAEIMGITSSRISIKATTTEELGFTGRREGIAAQAIVTVLMPDEV